ncbi:hypothetical protein JYQ62_29495 [Nostoc sp. UHCC 0702]|nr:hypothetical protein JYQ62_29495 [Nostoc sp. UHCC 0702]
MDILTLIITAFLVWAVERSADAVLNLVIELLRRNGNSNDSEQQDQTEDKHN